MTVRGLVRRNLVHFWRTNLAVVGGVAVAVAVLAGALLVGTSVRASLRDLALERLGVVDQVVTSLGFVRESLADDLTAAPGVHDMFGVAAPLIAVEGFITHQASGRRASAVQVYGVDERFWGFHGQEPPSLERTELLVSDGLADELGATAGEALLVRVEKPSAVPISSLHGRRDDVGRTLRLGIAGVLAPEALGEFSFRPQQRRARSVFVPLRRLQQELEQEGRINTVLLGFGASDAVAENDARLATAEGALRAVARLEDLGLRVRALPEHATFAVEAAAGLLTDETVVTVETVAETEGLRTAPVVSYLANALRVDGRLTPYSLVTGLDLELVTGTVVPVQDGLPPVVLNEWAAEDLEADIGATVTLEYYVWEDEGSLATRETELRVAGVIPLEGLANDRDLSPEYPGITEANNVIDWDPPFDVDLSLIRTKDEDYWDDYRTTPKAFIPLVVGQEMWATRWGRLTSIRLYADGVDLDTARDRFEAELETVIDPLATGFVVYPARALALEASTGATDFGLYFIYFSFFLVVSALLLASLFFRLGVEQRLPEVGLLRAAGFPPVAIRRLFWSEALVLSIVGSAIGVVGAMVYAELIMWGLRTWWVDAVGTTRLTLHTSEAALAGGVGGGIAAAFASIAWTLRALAPASARSLLSGGLSEASDVPIGSDANVRGRFRASTAAVLLAVIGLGLVGAASVGLMGATAGFFGGGLTMLCSMLTFAWIWLHGHPRRHTSGPWSVSQVGFRNTSYRPGRSVLCIALIASAAFIIVAVDAFRREGTEGTLERRSGTGGYTLLADTLLPIAHDPATDTGRDTLNLIDLYDAGEALDGVVMTRFRVRPGEDASCLNLYQAKDPRILAPTEAFVEMGRFAFGATLADTPETVTNPWRLLDMTFEDGAVPAIADATSLAYALHLSVGDDFVLNRDTDHPIRLRIVAALTDSIFQRELIIGEDQFERVFPDYDGYRFFLIDAAPDRMEAVSAALEGRLADYGFDVVSAGERLAAFHRVENTYLATFQTLGGLGLVLGTFGLGAVLLRNVLERRRELALLRAVGYNAGHLSLMVLAENALLLLAGVLIGTLSALVAIAPAWWERGAGPPVLSLGGLLVAVVLTGLAASLAATIAAVRSPLLQALRTE